MRLEELDFDLPPEAIAQSPAEPRDSCRLMHLCAVEGIEHRVFSDLPGLLMPGDTLVFNDSKVLPARVLARKASGGALELLFLRPSALHPGSWEALIRPSRRLRVGGEMVASGAERLTLETELGDGRWIVRGPAERSLVQIMEDHGRMPLPPYITTDAGKASDYQTVYAAAPGSVAAPTAGLHFTHELLERIAGRGVGAAWVTLHVGLDTFLPIREAVVEEHRIHSEFYTVRREALRIIRDTRQRGGRLIAVGTTATRVVETLAQDGALDFGRTAQNVAGSTQIFITPGYKFLAVDALLTNFHLPRSSVLTLTMAFAGVERIRGAYRQAIERGYRFFSFGDAMLIDSAGEPVSHGAEYCA